MKKKCAVIMIGIHGKKIHTIHILDKEHKITEQDGSEKTVQGYEYFKFLKEQQERK